MSITITTDVFCDWCSQWTEGATGPRTNAKKARRIAKRAGWIIGRKGDFCCRECADKAAAQAVT